MKMKCLFLFAALVVLGQLAAIPLANASSQYLRCADGFKKVATYSSSIQCRKIIRNRIKSGAESLGHYWKNRADCNAHRGKVWLNVVPKGNIWFAFISFKCANIN